MNFQFPRTTMKMPAVNGFGLLDWIWDVMFAAKPVEVLAQLTGLTTDGQPTGPQLWQQRKI
jgi:hypothetical protein